MRKYLYLLLITIALLTMGLALPNCGDNEGTKECDTNQDCVDKYGAGSWCDRTVWECRTCNPNCTGKCCGDDGCGSTCPDNCPTGYICDTDCTCKEDVECTTDQECVNLYGANYTCNLALKECECNADCSGKCCGSDGCGGTCPDNCTAPMTCNTTTCACEGCTDDSQCGATECCQNTVCVSMTCGALECGPDPTCGKECGPCQDPLCCNNGTCGTCPTTDLCPSGQDCVQVGANGSMGCVIPPNTVPPDNPTDCAGGNGCGEGNWMCYCMDATCSTSECIENCGECPAGSECCQYTANGTMACMLPGCTEDLPNLPYCDANTPCQGNSGCFTDGTNNWCAYLCSSDYGPCTNGDTKCDGDTVQTCTNGAWVDTTDCTTTSQVCVAGDCVTPGGLGDFCEDTGCEAGLDCVGSTGAAHYFCTPQCDCTNKTGCDTVNGWECMYANADQTICWCGKTCPNNNPATDCPNGGNGWACIETEVGSGVYVCDVQ